MADSSNIPELLKTRQLSVGYGLNNNEKSEILTGLNLSINQGELITLIGPNGCGKSTLIRSLAGILPLLNGEVFIAGQNAFALTAMQKSDILGIVLTDPVYEKNMTIYELVAMGRYHHTNWLGQMSKPDRDIVTDVLNKTDLFKKKNKRLSELSDGERQRAMIAKVLAQDAGLIILDEPTAHLDLANRMELMLLLKNLAGKMGKGILLSTHELSLGLQVSDKVWLINKQGKLEQSIPEELILNNALNNTFGNNHISFHPFSASFELVPDKSVKARVTGDGLLTACVIRLLKRLGIRFVSGADKIDLQIEVDEQHKLITVNNNTENKISGLLEMQEFLIRLINEL